MNKYIVEMPTGVEGEVAINTIEASNFAMEDGYLRFYNERPYTTVGIYRDWTYTKMIVQES